MTNLIAYLHKIYPLSDGCRDFLSRNIRTVEAEKFDFLLRAGQVCQNQYFVRSGLLRRFYYEGKAEISAGFALEGELMYSPKSFYEQRPSTESIQCLEDTDVEYIAYKDIESLGEFYPEFALIERQLHRQNLVLSEQHAALLRMPLTKDRYEHMSLYFPQLYQRIQNKYLASFLGCSIQNLSRIRNKK